MADRRVYCVGGHITNFVGKGNPNFNKEEPAGLKEYFAEAITGALTAARVPGEDIDRICECLTPSRSLYPYVYIYMCRASAPVAKRA